jgi:hypothetical protein
VAYEPKLIIQLPRGGAVDRQLSEQAPPSVASGDVLVERGQTDSHGHLEPPVAGQVVLSVPSPEALERDAAAVRRVLGQAGTGTDPLVVVVEAAEALAAGRDGAPHWASCPTDLCSAAPSLRSAGHPGGQSAGQLGDLSHHLWVLGYLSVLRSCL